MSHLAKKSWLTLTAHWQIIVFNQRVILNGTSHTNDFMRTSTINEHSNNTTQRNLRRLVLFRSISIAVQMLLIFVAVRWLALPLPLGPLATILFAHILWNGFTAWRTRQSRPVSDGEFFLQLLTDVLALSGVLYFSGGATNPFVGLYLLPLMIAATVLPRHFVWSMAGITVACDSLLMYVYLPLELGSHMYHDDGFSQHVFGMWFGFVFSAGLIAHFVTNMAQTLRQHDRELAAAREQTLHDERLVALGTLAAGAAHELGTPLNTMAIVTDELRQDYPPQKNIVLNGQLTLISGQIERCKEALSVISASAGELRADAGEALPADIYLQRLLKHWQSEHDYVSFEQEISGPQPAPKLIVDRSLDQAITNILNNAADASPDWVAIHAEWTEQSLVLEIRDRGPGLSADAEAGAGKTLYTDKKHGLGLGLYLTHSVIGRLGGEVTFFNDEHGSCTRISLPLLEDKIHEH